MSKNERVYHVVLASAMAVGYFTVQEAKIKAQSVSGWKGKVAR